MVMKKYTEQDRVKMHSTYRKYMDKLEQERKEAHNKLSPELKEFIEDCRRPKSEECVSALYGDLYEGLSSGGYSCPSEFIKAKAEGLFNGWIFPRRKDAVLYAADQLHEYAFAAGNIHARSFRTNDPKNLAKRVMELLYRFSEHDRFDADIYDIMTDNISEELLECKYFAGSLCVCSEELAYEIDRGNKRIIGFVMDELSGSGASFSMWTLIEGVVKSHSSEMHEALGRLLLAARLQEGLRQSICEKADLGTAEAFKVIFRVITENGLIRYSSVKRSFGTWLGIIAAADEGRASDLERISQKSAELVNSCLNDPVAREECLSSEDSMKIYIALWAKGFYEVRDMLDGIRKLSKTGSHHQLLTAGYAALNLCEKELQHEIAKDIIFAHYSEQDVMAVYLPCFMPGVDWYINYVVYSVPVSGGYSSREMKEDYTKRRYCELSHYFDSIEEGEQFYNILMSIYRGIKGKSVEFSPCIFPWNSAVLEKGEAIMRLAFLASALHDNDKIDEVAEHFGDIGGDYGYYNRRRVIMLLLTQPETDKQKRILAEEVCDKAEDAREAAFKIIDNTDIPRESYLFLESSLRYKNAQIRANIIKLP